MMQDKTIIRLSANPEGFGDTPDELNEDEFDSTLPTQHSYEYYEDETLGLFIGVWDTDDMREVAGPYAFDEFMWLIEGEAEIRNNKTGEVEKAKMGEAFIIPSGYDCQWHQTGYLRKFYVSFAHPNETIPEKPAHEGIIIVQADSPVGVLAGAGPFKVTAGATGEEHVCYKNASGTFISGRWATEAFESEPCAFPYNEFAYVHAGSITLTDEWGAEHIFHKGDAFFIPEGVMCSGKTAESVSLYFAIIQAG